MHRNFSSYCKSMYRVGAGGGGGGEGRILTEVPSY